MTSFDEVLEMKENGNIDGLIFNLKNENDNIRVYAAQALGYLGDVRAVEPLIAALKDENEKLRKESAMSLSIIGDKKAVEPLIAALKDESPNVRERAAFGLGELGDKDASTSLVELLNDENVKVREITFFSLESLKDETNYNVKEILENYKLKLGLNIQSLDLFRTPNDLIDFIGRIVSFWKPSRILDPASNGGSLVYGINSILAYGPNFDVFGFNREFFNLEREKIESIDLNMHFHDFFSEETELISKFDLVVSDIVLYNLLQNPDFKSNDFKIAILTRSLDLLKEDGFLIFIIPQQFLYSKDYRPIRDFLITFYSVEAIIAISNNHLYPYSGIPTSILIIKNSDDQNKDVFLAEYKEKHAKDIITNLHSKITNKNVSQGFFVDSKVLSTNIWTFDYLSGLEEFKNEVKSKDLIKLSNIVKILDTPEINENLLLMPKRWDIDNVLMYSEFGDDRRLEDYLLCKVFDDDIMPQYIKLYLNSDEGKKNIKALKSPDNLNENVLDNIYINIPKFEIQEKIFEADQKIIDLQNKIEIMYSSFQNKLSNYPDILELIHKLDESDKKELLYNNFIWPLATSHLIATKGSPNVNSQLDNYFKLFELIAAFNSIIFVSAIPDEIYKENKNRFFSPEFRTVSFGSWINLYRELTLFFEENEDNALFYDNIPFGKNFYKKLSDIEIFSILGEVVKYRNMTTGHGGVITEIRAKNIINNITPGLNEIFKKMNIFNKLKLIHTISFRKNNGIYKIKIRDLKGTEAYFPIKEIDMKEDMDTEVLYLYEPNSGNKLKLSPDLINLYECSTCARWGLYLYKKLKDKKTIYKSYQDEPHDKRIKNGKSTRAFLGF